MTIRFAFAILLFVMNIATIEVGESIFIGENDPSNATCSLLQAGFSSHNTSTDCSRACKDGLPCSDCGTMCCAQSLMVSTPQIDYPILEKNRFLSVFKSPLPPDLNAPIEPPRA